ncbi:MAG: chemotaxis protein CheA [Deltaproteobacteria bacterium]|nr:chemotaxis protein CheA [Deltaproteobacteria bacterium]
MDEKLLRIFAEESQEIIESLEDGLVNLEGSQDPERLNAVFRAAHTMKGNAGIVGFEDVVEVTHLIEGILDEMRRGRMSPDAGTVGLLLASVDVLKFQVAGRLKGERPARPDEVLAALEAVLRETEAPEEAAPAPARAGAAPAPDAEGEQFRYHIAMRFHPGLFASGTDPLQLLLELEELGRLSRVVCHTEDLPPYERLNPFDLYLWWEVWLESLEAIGTVENVFIFVQEDNQITVSELAAGEERPSAPAPVPDEAPAPAPPAPSPTPEPPRAPVPPAPEPVPVAAPAPPPRAVAPSPSPAPAPAVPAAPATPTGEAGGAKGPVTPSSTIRVDTDKLDKLLNLVGELVIGVARVNQIAEEHHAAEELGEAVESLDLISRDLQEQVMRVRMIPVEGTFNRFHRVVRDLAAELGKQIRLETSGTETELDKIVIEKIADPLKHLIRNSADHGLENPAEREAAGKAPLGTIWLRAFQQEGLIIIEVADDGRGIDQERVLTKARERGLVPPGAQPAAGEVYGYMFQPGFSTAAKVTEVSGRGVGLDVVKQNIEALRGSVEVESAPGRGTTFRIKLPLTLAIIDGMRVQVGEEVLTLPMLSILESIRPGRGEIKTVEGRGELVNVRGEYLPLVRLYELLDFPTERTDPTQALVVIIESVSRRFGILVDDILGEQQAVIKSLDQNYQKVDGVAGATILGDGRISLILDIHGLTKLAFG